MDIKGLEKMMKKDVGENNIEIKQKVQMIYETEICDYNFKVYGTKEEPLFLAQQVAEILDYSAKTGNTVHVGKMLKMLDDDEKLLLPLVITGDTQKREMAFITEDGLYRILMRSNQPNARHFQKQVSKILKQIRLTGGYIPVSQEDSELEIMSKAFLIAQRTIENQKTLIEEQNKKILLDAPKVDYHDKVLNCDKLISINEIANDIGISAKALNQFLKDKGIQYKQGKSWKIYSKYYFLIIEKYADYHMTEYGQQLKWTEKGRKFILDLYYSKDEDE